MTNKKTNELLSRARNLDEQALATIHDLYFPAVFRFVYFRFNDTHLAEDITSEVFVRLLNTLRKPDAKIRNLRAWLIGTADHLVIDHLRRRYRQPEEDIMGMEDLPSSDDTAMLTELSEQQKLALEAMRSLNQDQQQVISLRFLLECSVEETARIMGRSGGAVKLLQFRALAAMRKLLEAGKEERG